MTNLDNAFSHGPIEHLEDDRLGRSDFSRLLARALAGSPERRSMVVALYGDWGSGKTSTLNLCFQALEELSSGKRPLVMRFNPWWYSKRLRMRSGLRRRLERLEGKTEEPVEETGWYQRYLWMQRHYFPVLENYHREQEGLKPLPVPEKEPDPEFDAFWAHYLEAHEKNDPQMIQKNTEWWHRMRWERYGIAR